MSCGCNSNPCTTGECDAANEPLASALNNFITAFFGSLTKTCVNNQVVWVLPCDLDDGIAGYPRVAGEGLACYFLRVFNGIQASSNILVTDADTTPGKLAAKVVAGGGVTITVLNPGGDEQLQIDTLVGTPGQIGITVADTTIDFANNKLLVGAGLSKTLNNPGGNESLTFVNTAVGLVMVTGADTTPAVLNSKITVGPGLTKSTTNPGANEVLNITNAASVSIAASNIDWSLSNCFFKTLAANTVFTFTNDSDSQTIIAAITNTAGNFTAAWPAAVQWTNGSEPVLTLGAFTDVFTFVKINGVIYGSVVQRFS